MTATITLVVVFLGLGYLYSTFSHPYTDCGTCGGKGQHRGLIFKWARRNCHACSGRGDKQRLGAFILRRGQPRRGSSRIVPASREFGRRRR